MLEAVESSVNGGFSQFQSCGDSSEEELAVLPRHTKVVVTGNNRTKSVLVGLQGVVKKAVGLGGWHWLVLTNGIEVKLQRNALSVIEAPTGQEEDDEIECENMQWNVSDMASDETQKLHRPRHRSHRTTGSAHKATSRSHSFDLQSKGSVSPTRGVTKVDLSKLGTPALWRYSQYFKLVDSIPNPTKEQLIDVARRHFMLLVPIDGMVPERNSQSMGKAPMGLEKDGDAECEDMRWNDSHGAPEFTRKTYIPKHRLHKSIGADQKNISQGIRIRTSSDSQSRGSIPPTRGVTKVNLSKLETASLRRYCRFFNLMDAVSNSSKEHLLDAVQNHFMAQQVEEVDVIFEFARVAKRLKMEQSQCP